MFLICGTLCTLSRASATKLEVFQNHVMRLITGRELQDKDRDTIESLRSQTNLKPISAVIKERKLEFIGHKKIIIGTI